MERQVKERLVGAAVLMAAAVILIPEMLSGPDREFAEFADEAPNGAPLKTYTIDLSQPAGAALAGDRPDDRATSSVQSMDLQPKAPPQPAQAEPETSVSNSEAGRAATEQSNSLSAQPPSARSSGQDPASSRATAPKPPEAKSAATKSPAPKSPEAKSPEPKSPEPKSVQSSRPATDVVGSPTPSRATAPPAPSPANVAPKPSAPSSGAWAVQIGSYSRRDSAESQAARLRAAGHSAFVMPVRTQAGTLHRVRVGPMKDRAAAEASLRVLRNVAPDAAVVPHP